MSLTIGNSIAARQSTRRHAQVKTKNRYGAKIRSTFVVLSCSALLATGIIVVMQQLNKPVAIESEPYAKGHVMMESKADRRWEPIFFEEINERARLAKLPDLKTVSLGKNDLEVRVWIGFGVIPLEGIVIRRTNGTWTAIHLPSIYGGSVPRDSVKILPPPASGWPATWNRLTEEGILTLPDSSQLPDQVWLRDGESFVVETKTGDQYRTYHYSNPDHQKWDEAKRMLRVVEILSSEFNLQISNLSDTGSSFSKHHLFDRTSPVSESHMLPLESKMESSVYKSIIEGIYVKEGIRLIVVRDHSVPGNPADGGLYEQLQRAEKELTLLSQDTVTDFLRNNSGQYPLTTSLDLNVNVKRISESESNAIFEAGQGWEEFYEKFPSSQGVMELSKPGFNGDLTQALVYVGNQGGWKNGAGYYVLLVKENDAWNIKKLYTSWVS